MQCYVMYHCTTTTGLDWVQHFQNIFTFFIMRDPQIYLSQFSQRFKADRMSEKISLKRNDFQSKTSELFSALRLEKDFYDVTLVTDDDVQISAHKLILASSSGFFKSIFRKNIHPHPLLYLSEIDSKSLGFVLDYIYQGEVKMNQQQVDTFLKISRKLKIQDFMRLEQQEQRDKETEDFIQSNDREDSVENVKETDQINYFEDSIEDERTECIEDKPKPLKQSIRDLFLVKNEEKKDTEETPQEESEDSQKRLSYRENNIYFCENCKYFTKIRAHLLRHLESHVEGIKYECQFCDKTFQASDSFQKHIGLHHPDQGDAKVQSALKLTERQIISAEPRENAADRNVHIEEIFLVQELFDEKEMKKENNEDSSCDPVKYLLNDKKDILYKKNGRFQCFYCGYFSRKKDHAIRHAEVHMEGLSYQCCGKNFRLTEVYTKHLRKNHPDINWGHQLLQSKLKISESLQIFLSKY